MEIERDEFETVTYDDATGILEWFQAQD